MIKHGDILIPHGRCYCLRIDAVAQSEMCPGATYIIAHRFDLSKDRQPVFNHGQPLHIRNIREVAKDLFRDAANDIVPPHRPQYLKKWYPVTGQLELF